MLKLVSNPRLKRFFAVSLCILALPLSTAAQTKNSAMKKSSASLVPDKAFVQRYWDAWSTLDTANVAKFYASGPHTYFDIAPLKYGSWDEYEKGVKSVVSGYKSAKFTVNDDLAIHPHGDLVWAFPVDRDLGERRRQVARRARACLRTCSVTDLTTDFHGSTQIIKGSEFEIEASVMPSGNPWPGFLFNTLSRKNKLSSQPRPEPRIS